MCNSRNSKKTYINGKWIKLDKCISNLIMYLNAYEIKTCGSCCGHKKYPMTIVANFEGNFIDIISNIEVPRVKKFYKKDKQGYYFIPEVLEVKNGKRN